MAGRSRAADGWAFCQICGRWICPNGLFATAGTTPQQLEWPQNTCLKHHQCEWRKVRLDLNLSIVAGKVAPSGGISAESRLPIPRIAVPEVEAAFITDAPTEGWTFCEGCKLWIEPTGLIASTGRTTARYSKLPASLCEREAQCRWRKTKADIATDRDALNRSPASTRTRTRPDFVGSIFQGNGFLLDMFGILLFAAYFPAVAAWHLTNSVLLGLHAMIFGWPPLNGFSSNRFKDVLARRTAYIAMIVPILIGVAVAVAETVAIIVVIISGKPLRF